MVIIFCRNYLVAFDRPVDFVGLRLGLIQFLQLGFLGALVLLVDLFQLIGERSDQAARQLEHIRHGGALAIQEINLLPDFLVLRSRCIVRRFHVGQKLLIFRSGVKFLFVGLAFLVLLLKVRRIHLGEFGLVTAPRPQSVEFIVERPRDGQHQQEYGNKDHTGHWPACNRIIRRKLRHPVPPSRFDSDS